MKYAIINHLGVINRVTDIEPQFVPEGATIIEISDDLAQQIKNGFTANPRNLYLYKNGEFITLEQWREQQLANRPKPQRPPTPPPPPKPAVSAERHIEQSGYSAIRLVTLMDLELKLAQAGKTSVKMTAVRQWLDSILGAFAINPEPRNDWPQAPFKFEETIQDGTNQFN